MRTSSRFGLISFACAVLLAGGAAYAQEAKSPSPEVAKIPALSDSARSATREQATRELKILADSLNLTQEQRDHVRPILMAHATQMKMIRDKYTGKQPTPENRDAMKKDILALRDVTDGKLARVLTPDQMTKFKAWRDEMASRMNAKLSGAAGGK
jgi:hypothetical protein